MKLSELASRLYDINPMLCIDVADVNINFITADSREVKQGTLFLALQGHQVHGRDYLSKAIENGAVAIFDEDDTPGIEYVQNIPVIKIPKLGKLVSSIGNIFYDTNNLPISIIGITGTNGKTTTSHLVAMWATLLGDKSSVMGTVGNGLFGSLNESNNTTPSALEVHANIQKYSTKGASLCAMEVSSHGLVQYRVESVPFRVTAFLNLSRDHLDYHHSMQEYAAAKFRLFDELKSKVQIFNIDDAIGLKWFENQKDAIAVSIDYARFIDKTPAHYVFAKSMVFHSKGVDIEIKSSFGEGVLHSPLLGEFNVHNILTALSILLALGYDLTSLLDSAPKLIPVAGRMEKFSRELFPTVVVDYAHTPDALEKALLALKTHQLGKIWCVFGCGGDRDRGKRPLMASVAQMHADHVIVTDDNPRTEDRETITNDIISGFLDLNYQVIHDRSQAIKTAIELADKDDLILVAGKGHEDYQIIGHNKIHYSDRELMHELYHTQGLRLA
ncbi:UDP-N-acetylmuramoyl-L-alanyl-D-glutamate--2,6-diaminopimelate ligase [Thorsellia kenyensis]|uniref:UDP-N-acetylmuramoyl-L-alanyl-D-glutamate--2,6-diaminopimelate ligase n=1 Tax=Thorsellia kenyensis TaxID=1549888 RepID=A0ABV6CGN7_9GAMM